MSNSLVLRSIYLGCGKGGVTNKQENSSTDKCCLGQGVDIVDGKSGESSLGVNNLHLSNGKEKAVMGL